MEIVTATLLSFGILHFIQIDLTFGHHGNSSGTHVDPEYVKTLLRSGEYHEFEELLQVDNVDLEKPGNGSLITQETDFDDLLLKPDQMEEERQGINFANTPGKKWKDHIVPYVIFPEDYFEEDIEIIENAITSFNTQVKNIQFRKRTDEVDYVAIFAGNNGCYSHLGKMGGQNKLALQPPGCLRTGTIQHEMMHTVGFTHEHNSPIRDNFISVLYENIPRAWHRNYDKANADNYNVVGEYDYYSIMHYPMNAPQSRKPAFRILHENVSIAGIGQRLAMTKYDIEKIDNLYSEIGDFLYSAKQYNLYSAGEANQYSAKEDNQYSTEFSTESVIEIID